MPHAPRNGSSAENSTHIRPVTCGSRPKRQAVGRVSAFVLVHQRKTKCFSRVAASIDRSKYPDKRPRCPSHLTNSSLRYGAITNTDIVFLNFGFELRLGDRANARIRVGRTNGRGGPEGDLLRWRRSGSLSSASNRVETRAVSVILGDPSTWVIAANYDAVWPKRSASVVKSDTIESELPRPWAISYLPRGTSPTLKVQIPPRSM